MLKKISAYEYYCQLEKRIEYEESAFHSMEMKYKEFIVDKYKELEESYKANFKPRWFGRHLSFHDYCFDNGYYVIGYTAHPCFGMRPIDNSDKYRAIINKISCFDEYFYIEA